MSNYGKRIEWVDTARGILMGLVILGHAVAETSYQSPFYRGYILVFRWISVFHMPAFFILSGMLFSREKWEGKSLTAYVKRKAVSLLVPYFAFEGIALILQVYILGIKELKTALINTLICRSNLGADWFLPTLFAASVILFLISKTDKRIVQVLTGIVFISAAAFCSAEIHIQLVAGRCFIASFFMIIGYSFRRLLDQRINLVLCFFFFCLTILIAVINGQVGMYEIEMHNIILFIAGAVLGTTVIINVSKRFSIPACTRAGRDSLVIMGTHQHIIYIVRCLGISVVGFIPTVMLWLGMVVYSNLIVRLFYSIKGLLAIGKFGGRYHDEYGK